jgi:hypothetical protein
MKRVTFFFLAREEEKKACLMKRTLNEHQGGRKEVGGGITNTKPDLVKCLYQLITFKPVEVAFQTKYKSLLSSRMDKSLS